MVDNTLHIDSASLMYELVETAQGNNYLSCRSDSITTQAAVVFGDKIVRVTQLDITHEEYIDLLRKSLTNTLSFDAASGTVVLTPKAAG